MERPVPEQLPRVDVLTLSIAASPLQTWAALVRALDQAFGSRRARSMARVLGSDPTDRASEFPKTGSTLPGFRVVRTRPGESLAMEGRHRFARYALVFRLDPTAGGVRLSAETRGAFPGLRGRAYRALVIGTRAHVLVVRRILRATQRRAERAGTDSGDEPRA